MKLNFIPTSNTLTVYQIFAHLALLYLMFTGTIFEWAVVLLMYVLLVTVGGTITLHRLLSHRSFVSPEWFEYFGSIVASVFGCAGSTLAWVALHREHHRYSDTELDPHNPEHQGYLNVQFRINDRTPNIKYVTDLLRTKFHTRLHQYYWLYIFTYVSFLYLIDPRAIFYVFLVPSILYWHGGALTNTLNHSSFGYRNYDTKDKSVNNLFAGYVVSGEGWHNNHHHDPKNPKFGKKWYEFDLGWQIIKLIKSDK
jgi:stearoyl-CoA desaturase (delta-9 desaturase)